MMAINAPSFMGKAGVDWLSTAQAVVPITVDLQAGQVQHPEKLVKGLVTIVLPNIWAQLKANITPWSILVEKSLYLNVLLARMQFLYSVYITFRSIGGSYALLKSNSLILMFIFYLTSFASLLVYTLMAFHPIVILNSKYKKDTSIGIGSPVLCMTKEDAIHQSIKIKYHLPKVQWYGLSLPTTLLRSARKPLKTTR